MNNLSRVESAVILMSHRLKLYRLMLYVLQHLAALLLLA